jgi:sensor histidine kinase YesM
LGRYIHILFSCFLFCSVSIVKAQDTVRLFPGPAWDSAYEMEDYSRYYMDEAGTKDIREVLHQPFIEDTNYRKTINAKYHDHKSAAWIRWYIHNPSSFTENGILIFNKYSFLSVYVVNKDSIQFVKDNAKWYTAETKNIRSSFKFIAPAHTTITVYAQMKNPYRNFAPRYPIILREGEWQPITNQTLFNHRYYTFVDILFLSIIFFIAIHTLAQFLFNRRKEFLLYAIYATTVLIFFLFKIDDYSYIDIFFSHFPYVQKTGNNPLSYFMFFMYYRFVRSFIDFKQIAPWFFKVILITERILLSCIVIDIVAEQLNMYPVRPNLFNIVRMYLVIMGFTGIYLLFRSRNVLALFIAVGSGCLITGGLLSMVLSWALEGPYKGFDPIIYLQLGMVLELLCFTLGLSYKTSLIEKEKIIAQQQLIGQMEENKKLQDEMQTKLEIRVKEQTEKLILQSQQLEKEKEQQLMLEFTRKITEMELQLLKSQLNPHFYFNTLNNLYGLAMIAPKKAPDAILKLSDIMEYVIYDCRNDKVPLAKELKFLQSYIDLEKLRYEDDARISLDIKGTAGLMTISPMLLIQFVENGFKHGMEKEKGNSYLQISIQAENGHLLYESVNSTIDQPMREGGAGVGLTNARKRLELLYPGKHDLQIVTSPQEYKVILDISL